MHLRPSTKSVQYSALVKKKSKTYQSEMQIPICRSI